MLSGKAVAKIYCACLELAQGGAIRLCYITLKVTQLCLALKDQYLNTEVGLESIGYLNFNTSLSAR